MARRFSLTLRIAGIVSVFVALLIGAIILIIGIRLNASLNTLVLADNQQIASGRSLQLGELMDKLYWQLKMISVRNQFMTGDPKTIEAAVLDLNGKLSSEVVGALYIWPNGDYLTTEGARANVSDRDYYKAIFEKGQDKAVGEAVVSKALGVPIVVTAVAVKGTDTKTRGAVAFQFKLEKLSEIATAIKVGKTGYGWIIDQQGLVIAHPSKDAILKLNVTDADKTGYKGLDALGKDMIAKESGEGTYHKPDGSKMTVFYTQVPNSPGWTLGIAAPTAELNATTSELITLLLIIAVGGLNPRCRHFDFHRALDREPSEVRGRSARLPVRGRLDWEAGR